MTPTLVAYAIYILLLLIYGLLASSIIYHLHAFSLSSWKGRSIGTFLFISLSIGLIVSATISFIYIPWEDYAAHQNIFLKPYLNSIFD